MSKSSSARANPATGSVLLEYDPDVISPSNVGDLLATYGYALGATEADSPRGNAICRMVDASEIAFGASSV